MDLSSFVFANKFWMSSLCSGSTPLKEGFPAIVKNNSSSAAPSTQVEQLSTIEDEVKSSDSGNSSEGGIEVSNDEDVVDVVVDVNIINDK